ncbi:hypothetical protein [Thiocapsa marina]|nr:hypothetical protein [Thiocapsa marina]
MPSPFRIAFPMVVTPYGIAGVVALALPILLVGWRDLGFGVDQHG